MAKIFHNIVKSYNRRQGAGGKSQEAGEITPNHQSPVPSHQSPIT
ncbi:hypothetical protein [Sphaerospermopsis sp. FACHB-1194]|nr:hypothetical protein [Sphaerospermopsis sp. FACHB-1194]